MLEKGSDASSVFYSGSGGKEQRTRIVPRFQGYKGAQIPQKSFWKLPPAAVIMALRSGPPGSGKPWQLELPESPDWFPEAVR